MDSISRKITRQAGLAPQPAWSKDLPRVLDEVCERRAITREEIERRLEWDNELVVAVAGHLTVRETHFMRNKLHFDYLVNFLRRRLATSGLPYRAKVLSAGCATGEEPYSLAILLREHDRALANRVEIFATDISEEAIRVATTGVYGPWSFRGAERWASSSYFQQVPDSGHLVELDHRARRRVRLECAELGEYLSRVPSDSLDAILFRNVAIYLTSESVHLLFKELARVLLPGGSLIVAPADPRPSAEVFDRVASDPTSSVYLKVRATTMSPVTDTRSLYKLPA